MWWLNSTRKNGGSVFIFVFVLSLCLLSTSFEGERSANCTACESVASNSVAADSVDPVLAPPAAERTERASGGTHAPKRPAPAEPVDEAVVLDAAKKLHSHLRFLVNEQLGLTALQVG
jgi:hypothetical protein